MKKKGIIVSGYFNPIHKGHIEYFQKAKSLGDDLFVIVNNDFQRQLKGSQKFQLENERMIILSSIKYVNYTILSIDRDRSVCKSIEKIVKDYGDNYNFIFANGGDQNNSISPEKILCNKLGIDLVDGLGDKIQSSSWLINNKNQFKEL